MNKNLKILILAPYYHTFIKGPVDATARYVEAINVLIRYNYLTEFSKYFPIGDFLLNARRYTKDNILDFKGKPENVDVHLVSLLYFIIDRKNKSLGDKIANKAKKFIDKKKIKFDLIHAHFTSSFGYAAVKLGQIYNIPVVITVHEGRDWLLKEYNSKNERIYGTWKKADALIRVNQKDIPLLKEFNKNVFYVPNGFSSKSFYPIMDKINVKQGLNLPIDKKIILNVANLYPVKGQKYLIEAMKELVKYRKDILYIIIGDGVLRKDLKAQIKKLGLENYVKLAGKKPHDEIPLWMNAADLFVLPSLSEGNPTVMFEALGTALPFIGTKVGGVPEIINSEDYGLLCEPANTKELAEKILIGLDKKWDREKILEYAKRFTWENIAKEIMGVYNELFI